MSSERFYSDDEGWGCVFFLKLCEPDGRPCSTVACLTASGLVKVVSNPFAFGTCAIRFFGAAPPYDEDVLGPAIWAGMDEFFYSLLLSNRASISLCGFWRLRVSRMFVYSSSLSELPEHSVWFGSMDI
jgi:hypothetical protein